MSVGRSLKKVNSVLVSDPFLIFSASFLTLLTVKLMHRIVDAKGASHHDYAYGFSSDPLTQFACVFSALVHDVDHTGAPNNQLNKEGGMLAKRYSNKSVAEQNRYGPSKSHDVTACVQWSTAFSKRLTSIFTRQYRHCLESFVLSRVRCLTTSHHAHPIGTMSFPTVASEFCHGHGHYVSRTWGSVYNEVATKTQPHTVSNPFGQRFCRDKDLKNARNARWKRAFKTDVERALDDHDEPESIVRNRKATIVIEHLIQASDVAHTMQHWHIYRKWNERLFAEMLRAYLAGRAEKHPVEYWYQGEIGFFDVSK